MGSGKGGGGITVAHSVLRRSNDPFPPFQSFVPFSQVREAYMQKREEVIRSKPAWQVVFSARDACSTKEIQDLMMLLTDITLLIMYTVLQNNKFLMQWMANDADRTLLATVFTDWLTVIHKIESTKRGTVRCFIESIGKTTPHVKASLCSMAQQMFGQTLKSVFDLLLRILRPHQEMLRDLMADLPGILGTVESYCGIKIDEGLMESTKDGFRLLHLAFPKPMTESFEAPATDSAAANSADSSEGACPKCAATACEQCKCTTWTTTEKALAALLGVAVGAAVTAVLIK